MILKLVGPTEVTDEDIRWLTIGCLQCTWEPNYTATEIVRRLLEREVMLYRLIDNRCVGIVVLSIDWPREWLWIETIAGKGLMKVQEEFRDLLRQMAKEYGLKQIAGFVKNDGLARFYDRHTRGKAAATLYLEEIDYDRRDTSDHQNQFDNEQDSLRPSGTLLSPAVSTGV